MSLPQLIEKLLEKQQKNDSEADFRSRQRAVKTMMMFSSSSSSSDSETSCNERTLLAAVAATIHPRHLWSCMQFPPLSPALTPWSIQNAVKSIRKIRIGNNDDNEEILPTQEYIDERLSKLRLSFRRQQNDSTSSTTTTKKSNNSSLITKCQYASDFIEIHTDQEGDGVNGNVRFSQDSCPANTPIFKIPSSFLFNKLTVEKHCALAALLCSHPWNEMLDSDGEALLILSLIFEKTIRGNDDSHWSHLLKSCPSYFPHIPLCWEDEDLMFLDPSMFSTVAEKGEQIDLFVSQCQTLLKRVEEAVPYFQKIKVSSIVTAKSVTWARCVFDSRSFILRYQKYFEENLSENVSSSSASSSSSVLKKQQEEEEENGRLFQELTTLAPFVDMLNHNSYSDILTKRIDINSGDFIMATGSKVEQTNKKMKQQEREEVFLCYGPLETWDLLISYGFVPQGAEDGKNVYDVLPVSIIYDAEAAAEQYEKKQQQEQNKNQKEEKENDEEAEEEEEPDPLAKKRVEAIKVCGLESIQTHGIFLPVDGQIPVAVKQLISIWHATSEEELDRHIKNETICSDDESLEKLLQNSNNNDNSSSTLQVVYESLSAYLKMYLDSLSTTAEEDETLLKDEKSPCSKSGTNANAAVIARLTLKRMALRAQENLKKLEKSEFF